TRALGDAHLGAVGLDLVAHACGLALVHEHHVAGVDRHVAVDDAAGLVGLARLAVLLGRVDAVDEEAVARRQHLHHFALPALVLAGDDNDGVALPELHGHSTSGASDTMRMNFLSRSSRPTGPKMRVPRGV